MVNIREDAESPGLLPQGDVLIVVNGGRKSDASLLGCFGMTKERKQADKGKKEKDGKTICREPVISLDEQSVIARKFRRKTRNDFLTCQQKAYIYYNATTGMKSRPHKFSSASNMSDVIGPFTLTCLKSMPKLTVKEKREFWGARRRAVGGRTDDGRRPGLTERTLFFEVSALHHVDAAHSQCSCEALVFPATLNAGLFVYYDATSRF